ncbi:right-handed parallel beta-helix repeat-containing protein [Methanogenium sp. S4BF]|uniref:right-handed parallel beta-helix repeat-containing protein n=1 Tax=Methanogenium sp. S4BF TaxID=1789226 RepID=UPI0024169AE2|nr:right-handed parallel beta-helix repeat-containing protein [Methanogenium sp. S4BF]WFN35224.1 right-handed parallel beta-helix repeat-containing protein [Methanogenium sp. S4BF]
MEWYMVVALIFGCMLLPSAAAAVASPADGEEYGVIWGSFAPADRESVHSYGIAMDTAGNVYVNDPETGRIRTYSFGDLPSAGETTFSDVPLAGIATVSDIPTVRANEWTVGPNEDDDFAAIQSAIDAAADGDTVIIGAGTYREDVVVDKPLILVGGYDTAIDGKVTLTADECSLIGCMVVYGVRVESDNNTLEGVLTGWTVTSAGPEGRDGFIVRGSHNTFTDCIVDGFYLGPAATGIIIDGTTGNTFTRSGVIDSCTGAHLIYSSGTTFRKCIFFARGNGILLSESTNTTVIDCSMRNTDYMNAGVFGSGSGITFTNCDIFGGGYGVFLIGNDITFTNCDIFGGKYGAFNGGYENKFTDCDIFGDEYGVFLDASHMDSFTGCTISSYGCGVYQGRFSENNIFTRCTVHGDTADWCGFAFFADDSLEDAVREALGIPDGDISAEELRTLSVLSAPDRGIVSLSGLEFAASLQVLLLDNNRVSDLWPLAGLTGLHELVISHNEVRDLTPLVANSDAGELGPGNVIDLRYNGLDLMPGSAAMTAIETLAARGVLVLYEPQETMPALSAAFAADVTEGAAPLTVAFTDRSTGGPEEWFWDFGDGTTSTEQHPVHTYATTGTCTVCLTVTNADGSDTTEQVNCICVDAPPAPMHEFPEGGGILVMGMVCGILGGVGVFVRRNNTR